MADKRPNIWKSSESVVHPGLQPLPTEVPPTITAKLAEVPQHANVVVDEAYEKKSLAEAQVVYTTTDPSYLDPEKDGGSGSLAKGLEEMRERTERQIAERDKKLREAEQNARSYDKQYAEAETRHQVPKQAAVPKQEAPKEPQKVIMKSSPTPVTNIKMSSIDSYIQNLSQPQFNAPFDVIPLPSEGKIYGHRKPNVKIAFLTTADENILTSPNLINSGEFLEILINRKLLETDLRYKDLHIGDRNAIMLWLRATSYGEMYPVTVFDNDDNPFNVEIDLNSLKTKKLGAEPDAEGLFDFSLPLSRAHIKFKFLTVSDVDHIDDLVRADAEAENPINNSKTYVLQHQIVEVNGNRNSDDVRYFIDNMRVKDATTLREYIDSIESGVDMHIEVPTPGGGSVKTFLPLNLGFFWPELAV